MVKNKRESRGSCAGCEFWTNRSGKPSPSGSDLGECKRNAPTLQLVLTTDPQSLRRGEWPTTIAMDGCGEYVSKASFEMRPDGLRRVRVQPSGATTYMGLFHGWMEESDGAKSALIEIENGVLLQEPNVTAIQFVS